MSYPMGAQSFPGQQQQLPHPQQQYMQQQQQHQQHQQQQHQQHQQQQQQPGYGGGGGAPQAQGQQQYGSGSYQQNIFDVNAWQAMSFNSEDEFVAVYEAFKSQTFNAIQAQELMRILNETPRIKEFYRISWSLELCKVMLAMLDRSKDGMMQFPEFKELLQCLVFWYNTFCQYDQNRSGYMEAQELNRVFTERFGYRISQKAMTTILKRYARATDDRRLLIAFDDFVACCVRLRAYTEAFRARDRMSHNNVETGSTQFGYDDFLQCVMCL